MKLTGGTLSEKHLSIQPAQNECSRFIFFLKKGENQKEENNQVLSY